MKRLVILDGSGYLFRAYYGLPVLTNEEWYQTHAVYGVVKMLMKLWASKPDYFVIARDAPQKTHRHEAYAEYKANRPSAPQELKRQIGQTKELIAQLGIHTEEIPGYEADDIIATIAKKFGDEKDLMVEIESSDKDLKQLITDNIICIDSLRDYRTDAASFVAEHGFPPTSMLDYLSLVGDASDNVPGVSWIGKVGAQKLIAEYTTLENIYDNIDDISGWTQQKLIDGKESAFHSKMLIQLMDVPDMEGKVLKDYMLDLDFDRFRTVMIDQRWFTSARKAIDELRLQRVMPEQTSLFG